MRTVGIMIIVRAVVVRITAVLTSRQLVKRSKVFAMKRFLKSMKRLITCSGF